MSCIAPSAHTNGSEPSWTRRVFLKIRWNQKCALPQSRAGVVCGSGEGPLVSGFEPTFLIWRACELHASQWGHVLNTWLPAVDDMCERGDFMAACRTTLAQPPSPHGRLGSGGSTMPVSQPPEAHLPSPRLLSLPTCCQNPPPLPGGHLWPPSPHTLPGEGQRGPGWSPPSTGKKFGEDLGGWSLHS